jgi:hypothetical protein
MQWSKGTRIAAIVCGTCMVLGVIAGAVVSGATIDVESVLGGLGALVGALLGGLGAAAGPSPAPRDGTQRPRHRGGGAVCLALAAAFGASACSGAQLSHSEACATQRAVVDALDAGVAAAAEAPGTDGEQWAEALRYSGGVVDLGRAATRGCELHRGSAGWAEWVGLALETTVALAARFGGAGPGDAPHEPPAELVRARAVLEAETRR